MFYKTALAIGISVSASLGLSLSAQAHPTPKLITALNADSPVHQTKGVTTQMIGSVHLYQGPRRLAGDGYTQSKPQKMRARKTAQQRKPFRTIRTLRTQGFYAGAKPKSRRFTQGFYSGD